MKKNIFWFIIDSVRTYRAGLDDRDRLDIMDELAEDSAEFKNCFTSAPSSLLAAGSLFTGQPSVFVARHFNDWKFTDPGLSTISTLVKDHGYQSIPLIDAREGREKYQDMLPPFPSKFLPKNYNLRDYAWSNNEVTNIFEHIIKNHAKPPFAFVFWYDCRRDPKVSDHVKRAINLIKEEGHYDDSIIIMNSDHGYPDPNTSLNEKFFRNRGHDMILTDDNIKTPLILKYPGVPKGKSFLNVVGHIDIIPTIFDILKIPMEKKYDNMEFRGKSLLDIIERGEKDERVIRTDTRLRMDNDRITSYRSSKYKFIKFQDTNNNSVIFDMIEDPKELKNLLEFDEKKFNDVKNFFEKLDNVYEQKLMENHTAILKENFLKVKGKLKNFSGRSIHIVIVTPAPIELIKMLIKLIREITSVHKVTVINMGPLDISDTGIDKIINFQKIDNINFNDFNNDPGDLLIYLTHNSRRVYLKNEIVKYVGKIKSKKKILMNYNFEIFQYFSLMSIFSYVKLFFDFDRKGYFYKQEPLYFLSDLWFYFTRSIQYFLKVKVRKKMEESGDLMTAREVMAYRNFQLKSKMQGREEMSPEEMIYETQRIKDWGKE